MSSTGTGTGTCAEPGPYAAHCTDYPGHAYSCYDAGKDVSFNDGTMADSDAVHDCSDPECPDQPQYVQVRGERLHLWCPGCEDLHVVTIGLDANDQPLWTWDGNTTQPTISPSILVTREYGADHRKDVCHSFLKAGTWDFLSDCTHGLAGQQREVVPLPLWLVRESH